MRAVTKTARFINVVHTCGHPQIITLWQSSEKLPKFQKAVRENKVMTLKQPPVGTGKDFGIVGFFKEKDVSYLIFPGSLDDFEDRKIVGIDYSLINSIPLAEANRKVFLEEGGYEPAETFESRSKTEKPDHDREHANHSYSVELEVIARKVEVLEVEAPNSSAARRNALKLAEHSTPNLSNAEFTRRVRKVQLIPATR